MTGRGQAVSKRLGHTACDIPDVTDMMGDVHSDEDSADAQPSSARSEMRAAAHKQGTDYARADKPGGYCVEGGCSGGGDDMCARRHFARVLCVAVTRALPTRTHKTHRPLLRHAGKLQLAASRDESAQTTKLSKNPRVRRLQKMQQVIRR
jgi:hypothetical protein